MMIASSSARGYHNDKYYDYQDTPSRGRSSGGTTRAVDHHSPQPPHHQNGYSHQDSHSQYHNQTSAKHFDEQPSHVHSPQRVNPAHVQHGVARPIRGVLKHTARQPHMGHINSHKAQPTVHVGTERYNHAHRPALSRQRSVRFDEEDLERPASSSYSSKNRRSPTSYEDSSSSDSTHQASYQQPTYSGNAHSTAHRDSAHYETSPSPRRGSVHIEHKGISPRRDSIHEQHTSPSPRRNSIQNEHIRPTPHREYSHKATMRPKSYPESAHQHTKVVVHAKHDQHHHHDYHHGEVEHNHQCSHGSLASGHSIYNGERDYPQHERYSQYSTIAAPRPIRAHHYDEDEQRHIVVVVPPCDHAKRADKRNFMHRVKKVWAAATHDGTIPPPSPPSSPSPEDHHPKQTHTKDGKPMGKFAHLYDGDWKVDFPVNEGEMM